MEEQVLESIQVAQPEAKTKRIRKVKKDDDFVNLSENEAVSKSSPQTISEEDEPKEDRNSKYTYSNK
jgi:hypothetical protein